MRYSAYITTGSLKVAESRIIADMLLTGLSGEAWTDAVVNRNALQARSRVTARRLARLIRSRLMLMDADLWRLVRDGNSAVATHAVFAATVKQSPLLGDFLDIVVRDKYRHFVPKLSNAMWDEYLNDCRGRDPDMPLWNESTRNRLRSTVFQALAQAGYLENTRSLVLQPVHIAPEVIRCLQKHNEEYVLRCIQVSP
jgi:hypothetical protein